MKQIYLLKQGKEKDFKKTTKWQYLNAQNKAGYMIQNNYILESFCDPQHNISGYVKEE